MSKHANDVAYKSGNRTEKYQVLRGNDTVKGKLCEKLEKPKKWHSDQHHDKF